MTGDKGVQSAIIELKLYLNCTLYTMPSINIWKVVLISFFLLDMFEIITAMGTVIQMRTVISIFRCTRDNSSR